ncbi:hypothetical protein Aduo_005951 [Ancylostoma duodenale]
MWGSVPGSAQCSRREYLETDPELRTVIDRLPFCTGIDRVRGPVPVHHLLVLSLRISGSATGSSTGRAPISIATHQRPLPHHQRRVSDFGNMKGQEDHIRIVVQNFSKVCDEMYSNGFIRLLCEMNGKGKTINLD